MQCLYCGKVLGVLKELTDGEFCSGQHRQRYKKLTKIAVNRLLASERHDSSPEPPQELHPEPHPPIPLASPAPGYQHPVRARFQRSGVFSGAAGTPQSIPADLGPFNGARCRLPGPFFPKPEQNSPSLARSPAYRSLPKPVPQPGVEPTPADPSEVLPSVWTASAMDRPALNLPLATTTAMVPGGILGPSCLSPPISQPCSARDESYVQPILRVAAPLALPRLEVVTEQFALTTTSALPVDLGVAGEAPAPATPEAETLQFRFLAVRTKPVFRGQPVNSRIEGRAAPAPFQSHTPCLEPRPLSIQAHAGATGLVMQGADWHFSTTAPHLAPAFPNAARGSTLGAGAPRSAVPAALPGSAAASTEARALDFSAPGLRLLGLATLQPRLSPKRVEALEQEIVGTDVSACPVAGGDGPGLVGSSVLPALASLFRYCRPVETISSHPMVSEAVAAQDSPVKPVAYSEIPMRGPKPVLPKGSPLGIVETFEYLRPLDGPPFELLQSLVHLWKTAPAYIRFASVAASVMLMLWASLPGTALATLFGLRWSQVEARIRSRATVELSEDFQDGMQNWDGEGDWSRTWRVQSAGYVRPGSLALYQPSMKMEGYRMEFLVQIERRGVGWAYRATDEGNYYAAKITIARPGPLPLLSLVRYPVIDGQAGPRVEIPIRVMLHNDTPYRVQLTVNGVDYTTAIEGQLVDFWHDERLRTGGVGFFADSGERARIYWMRLTQKDDFVGRVCAYFYPNPIQARSSKRSL